MSIPVRLQIENGMYHIIVRGNNKEKIFFDNEDYKIFLKFLDQACKKYNVIIYTYCLMTNHYHLHIETIKANLIQFMHWLNMEYVININYKYKRTGHLFQGRYTSLIIEKDTYCLALNRYIHLNPVNAGIVQSPEDYQWSSLASYLNHDKSIKSLNIEYLLNYFGKQIKKAILNYKNYINEGLQYKVNNLLDRVKGELILGSDAFIEKIQKRIGKNKLDINLYTQVNKLRKIND